MGRVLTWRRFILPAAVVIGLVVALSLEAGPGARVVPFRGSDIGAKSTTTTTSKPAQVDVGAQTTDSDLSAAPGEKRMTGGGTVVGSAGTTSRGFIIRCDLTSKLPNRLEVNWDGGNKFHLDKLTYAQCTDDPAIGPAPPAAGFDTFVGTGTGRLNGVDGATIGFKFTDAGEPGTSDTASIIVKDKNGNTVMTASGFLVGGNNQAHK